ncbi:MAG: HlyC/CorC family transporter [Paludibacteraceae bacterium]|nr:HlyC/CorC family transporter [Paludibacteraceae bacterium]
MVSDVLMIILWALLFSFFFGGEMAFAFFNRLRLELVRDELFHNKLHAFFFKRSSDFSNVLFVADFIAFFLLVRQVYVTVCTLPFLQMVGAVLLCIAFTILLVDLLLHAISYFSATSVFMLMAYPLFIVYWVVLPIAKLVVFVVTLGGLLKIDTSCSFSINRIHQVHEDAVPADNESEDNHFGDEVVMFQNALDFSKVRIKDSMVPRTEIVAIDINSSLPDLKELFVATHFSRILVYRDTIDNVLGYVHSADMFDNPASVEQMLNPIIVVPETMTANNMLRLFLKQKKSLALVVDEFGGTSGILTIEDVMEEIFGEIEDEHDADDADELVSKKIGPNEYVVSGRMEIEEVNSELGLDLPLGDDYLTVGGLILSKNAFLPAVGDVIQIGERYSFKVVRRSPSRIDVVRLVVNNPDISKK